MSDTPRTDALCAAFERDQSAPDNTIEEFARTLERELAKIADVLEPHWRGAGAPLEAGWMVEAIASLASDEDGANERANRISEYAEGKRRLVKAAEVILGLWSETELDPEDEEYEAWMAAFTESVTGWLTEARAALAAPSVAQEPALCPFVLLPTGGRCRCRAGHSGVHVDIDGCMNGTWSDRGTEVAQGDGETDYILISPAEASKNMAQALARIRTIANFPSDGSTDHPEALGRLESIFQIANGEAWGIAVPAAQSSHAIGNVQEVRDGMNVCGYCHTWRSKPCGEGCMWDAPPSILRPLAELNAMGYAPPGAAASSIGVVCEKCLKPASYFASENGLTHAYCPDHGPGLRSTETAPQSTPATFTNTKDCDDDPRIYPYRG